jgi:hypothetical protein
VRLCISASGAGSVAATRPSRTFTAPVSTTCTTFPGFCVPVCICSYLNSTASLISSADPIPPFRSGSPAHLH